VRGPESAPFISYPLLADSDEPYVRKRSTRHRHSEPAKRSTGFPLRAGNPSASRYRQFAATSPAIARANFSAPAMVK
jgi:hypothetical protein